MSPSVPGRPRPRLSGFTLIEIVMAMSAAALILAAIYGLFSRAIHLRDTALERTKESRLRSRAVRLIRNDLRNAFLSGRTLAAILQGSQTGTDSGFPGYLTFTTTTGDAGNTGLLSAASLSGSGSSDGPDYLTQTDDGIAIGGDVQQVEYFVVRDPDSSDSKAGMLVRTASRNLLAPVRKQAVGVPILSGVTGMEVTFFDGQNWLSSWDYSDSDTTIPQAVRVVLDLSAPGPPLEIVVPWTVQPENGSTTTTSGTAS